MSMSRPLDHDKYVFQIANNIRYYCDTRGVSCAKLEKSAGVTLGYVSRLLLHPETKIRFWTILQFANAMDVDAPTLIFTDLSAKEREHSLQRIKDLIRQLETEQKGSIKTLESIEKALQEPDKTSLFKAEKELQKALDKIKKDKKM